MTCNVKDCRNPSIIYERHGKPIAMGLCREHRRATALRQGARQRTADAIIARRLGRRLGKFEKAILVPTADGRERAAHFLIQPCPGAGVGCPCEGDRA